MFNLDPKATVNIPKLSESEKNLTNNKKGTNLAHETYSHIETQSAIPTYLIQEPDNILHCTYIFLGQIINIYSCFHIFSNLTT